ncbi:MAG: cytochrome c oxidase subunit II [Bacteroidales bacterium]|jgi:cytochrome c oxidase subunit 2|nr:cytochrome c oxidase subunit II [Bacteroidales bacterium]MCU0408256.1 cytochrome c oxidase subunit II [Bacteroidales bacterium]
MFTTGASNLAEAVDKTFIIIFSIAGFFIVGITAFMIYSVIKFNRKKGVPARQFSGSNTLELIWTVIPLAIVMVMFIYGWRGFAPMRKAPADAMVVTAIGRMWEWEFDYGNGIRTQDLVLPVNKAVRINLKSEDVNHSLFIPAFRVKEDVIPGYETFLWFIPTTVGEYEILCTEYCGLLHSSMLAKAKILEQGDYDSWFAESKETSSVPEPDGYLLLRNTGCIACHSLDGTKLVGPSFLGLFGSERRVVTKEGTISVTADEKYIEHSIYDPNDQLVEGYARGLMQSYTDVVTAEQLVIITDYLKTLTGGN